MPKLKALRGSIGAYGRVKAGGIVEVDDDAAKKLLATKRFVPARAEDIAAAAKAQEEYLKVETVGVTPGFAPLPEAPQPIESATAGLELDAREKLLEERATQLEADAKRLHDLEASLKQRQAELDAREKANADLDQTTVASAAAAEDAATEAKDAPKGKGSK